MSQHWFEGNSRVLVSVFSCQKHTQQHIVLAKERQSSFIRPVEGLSFDCALFDKAHSDEGPEEFVGLTAINACMFHYREFGSISFFDSFYQEGNDFEMAPVFLSQWRTARSVFVMQRQIWQCAINNVVFHLTEPPST